MTEPLGDAPDVPAEPSTEGGETPAEQTQGGRGRPRPDAVVARDQRVLEYLRAQVDETGAYVGKSRDEVAQATGLPGNQVYLSFYRLKRDGLITKGGVGGAQKWAALAPAPAEPIAV
jgi:hypothetical protein